LLAGSVRSCARSRSAAARACLPTATRVLAAVRSSRALARAEALARVLAAARSSLASSPVPLVRASTRGFSG